MPGEILLEINNLEIQRNGELALDIPRLSIKRGLTYALMGPNGAGKTTLLNCLNRLERPLLRRGSISFDGCDLFSAGEEGKRIQRRMTLVMQSPLLFDTTVGDNMAYGLKARGLPEKEISQRVVHYLARVGLKGFEKRPAKQLSGGETQRVALARALALEPELLLLDEPTTFIDRGHANFIERLILDIGAEGRMTIIFSTHNIRQAHRLADEVINLHLGRICPADMVNIFHVEDLGENLGTRTCYVSPNFHLQIAAQDNPGSGLIAIDPREIEISRTPPERKTPNCYEGRITRLENLDDMVLLTVDVGERLVAQISREAVKELHLGLDTQVWVTLKEKAVQTF